MINLLFSHLLPLQALSPFLLSLCLSVRSIVWKWTVLLKAARRDTGRTHTNNPQTHPMLLIWRNIQQWHLILKHFMQLWFSYGHKICNTTKTQTDSPTNVCQQQQSLRHKYQCSKYLHNWHSPRHSISCGPLCRQQSHKQSSHDDRYCCQHDNVTNGCVGMMGSPFHQHSPVVPNIQTWERTHQQQHLWEKRYLFVLYL